MALSGLEIVNGWRLFCESGTSNWRGMYRKPGLKTHDAVRIKTYPHHSIAADVDCDWFVRRQSFGQVLGGEKTTTAQMLE
jgi:hypothetical protein